MHVNFFGPKDEYFLSGRVEAAEGASPTHPRCYYLDPPLDLQQPVMRAAGVRVAMTQREIAEFRALTCDEAARSEWFFTRLLAKDAVRAAWRPKHGEAMFPADIETDVIDGRIVCRPRGQPGAEPFPPVAVAVAKCGYAAFSAFAERVGVALVPVLKKGKPEAELRIDAARMAVADALRVPVADWSVAPGQADGVLLVSQGGRRLRVQTTRQKNAIIATTVCEAG
jgi:hypothetical protein